MSSFQIKPAVRLLSLTLGLLIIPVGCISSSTTNSLEEQAQGIDKNLMCPVCPSETIDQSQVELAKQMRAIVREKLGEGLSREQTLQFFVDRYGPSILAEPPKSMSNILIWIIPPIALGLGSLTLVLAIRGMRKIHHERVPQKEPIRHEDLEPYLLVVDLEIAQLMEPSKGMTPDSSEASSGDRDMWASTESGG